MDDALFFPYISLYCVFVLVLLSQVTAHSLTTFKHQHLVTQRVGTSTSGGMYGPWKKTTYSVHNKNLQIESTYVRTYLWAWLVRTKLLLTVLDAFF